MLTLNTPGTVSIWWVTSVAVFQGTGSLSQLIIVSLHCLLPDIWYPNNMQLFYEWVHRWKDEAVILTSTTSSQIKKQRDREKWGLEGRDDSRNSGQERTKNNTFLGTSLRWSTMPRQLEVTETLQIFLAVWPSYLTRLGKWVLSSVAFS